MGNEDVNSATLNVQENDLRPLKAYTVREGDEGHAVVVFARHGVVARRQGADQLDIGFDEVESVTRSPELDEFANAGKVPPLALIEKGWWFECDYCGHKLDSDAEGPEGEELHLVADGSRVYCSTAHLMAEWRRRRDIDERMNAVVEACALRFFGLPISRLSGHAHYTIGGEETVSCCDFDFPGRKGMLARWDLGSQTVLISECDMDAWAATLACGRRAAKA